MEKALEFQVESPRTCSALTSGKKILLFPSSLCLLSQSPQVWGRKPNRGQVETRSKAGSALRKEERGRSSPLPKPAPPKKKIANGAWDLCPQVQMSQRCQVLDRQPFALLGQGLPSGEQFVAGSAFLPHPVPLGQPFGRGPYDVRLSWQSPLQLPICSSFALQGPRKTALRNQEKWEGGCLGRSLPARLFSAPFNPVTPIPGSSSQLLRAFFSKTTYFLSLACGHGKTQ